MEKKVVVTGDVVVDHHLYEGRRYKASATDQPGIKIVRQCGGVMGLSDLISAVMDQDIEIKTTAKNGKTPPGKASETCWSVQCALEPPNLDTVPSGQHALALWKPYPKTNDSGVKPQFWRVSRMLGYGQDQTIDSNPSVAGVKVTANGLKLGSNFNTTAPDILVLDDAGAEFRNQQQKSFWLLPSQDQPKPCWIILKTAAPLFCSDLWTRVTQSFADRLIVVVAARELRAESININKGLSWEATVESLRSSLCNSPLFHELSKKCRHLVITFYGDGALWLNFSSSQKPTATMVYDPGGIEEQCVEKLDGEAFGFMSCMTAAIVREMIHALTPSDGKINSEKPHLDDAMAAGLSTMQDLRRRGHGRVGAVDSATGFPVHRLAQVLLRKSDEFQHVLVPWPEEKTRHASPWRIIEQAQIPFHSDIRPSLLGLARLVVIHGTVALKKYPHAEFGDLFTADRAEIESLRSIRSLMRRYDQNRDETKPLSIGVFGPPGAGKSFGVRQVADSIFKKEAWKEYNLSQFNEVDDLIGAFHEIRDIVLGGITPVIFWDEFDSQEYRWLQYLLAPMQDGRFQDRQMTHRIGKCVFIFAGATSHTFKDFGPAPADPNGWKKFVLGKGPDFHSRIDAYYDVLGPNPRLSSNTKTPAAGGSQRIDSADRCYPLRRAILLRSYLAKKEKGLLDIDPGLLTALLEVPWYRHGARSLSKLAQSLKPERITDPIRRSCLPPPGIMALHLSFDYGKRFQEEEDESKVVERFFQIMDRNLEFIKPEIIDKLAPAIHKVYTDQQQNKNKKKFKALSDFKQNSNRAAAERMWEILALVGLSLAVGKATKKESEQVERYLAHHIELLAEAEHDGWMKWHFKQGWRYAKQRDDAGQLHNCLLPFSKLTQEIQDYDRAQILNYPKFAREAGLKIIFPEWDGSADRD